MALIIIQDNNYSGISHTAALGMASMILHNTALP